MNVRARNKKRLAIIGVLLAVILGAAVIMGGISFSTGRYIKTASGSSMIVMDNSPVVMINETGNNTPFDDYSTGDSLLIVHGPVAESYPGSTPVYHALCLNGGSAADIPRDILTELQDMDWVIIPE